MSDDSWKFEFQIMNLRKNSKMTYYLTDIRHVVIDIQKDMMSQNKHVNKCYKIYDNVMCQKNELQEFL